MIAAGSRSLETARVPAQMTAAQQVRSVHSRLTS